MTLGGLATRLAGGEIERPLRGPLAVVFLQAVVEGGQASFLGLWALRVLHASQSALGLAFAVAAVAGVGSGYLAGRASDAVGRRTPVLIASAALPLVGLGLAAVRTDELAGLALMVALGGAGGALLALNQALFTDVVPADRHEHAFAAARVVQNVGVVFGPLIAALLLGISWRALFLGTSAIAAIALVVAVRAIPARVRAPREAGALPPGASLRTILRDRGFVWVLAAATLGMMVYVAYQALLPISLVQSHGFEPRTWGFLLALNPIVVVLFQIRLSASVGAVRERTRITAGILLMATPFLLVAVSTAIPLVVLMLLVFVLGEMLWAPPAQALLVRIAPEGMRGAYLGAGSASVTVALALGPLLGLEVRSALGDTAMWCAVALLGVLAIAVYAVAERYARRDASLS